jgi:hypothetical protein
MNRNLLPSLLLPLFVAFTPIPAAAQAVPDLLVAAKASSAATRRDVPSRRGRKVGINAAALNSATLRLQLFDDLQLTVHRKTLGRPGTDKIVWVGDGENGAQAVLTMVRGVLTGTVFADHRTFEITIEPDGQYSVAELDPGAFPTDDPQLDDLHFEVLEAPDAYIGDQLVSTADAAVTGTPVTIDVMVVWTPAAEAASGGRAAMESLALNSVANANLVYRNSGVNAQLNLVHATQVDWVETPTSITTDLTAIRSVGDGKLEEVHALRTQYGADVVSLFGEGYRNSGACGVGGLMSTVSTSFASYAFNVVDRTCAVGNLSFVHEVGHNQGLQHDPANATTAPSYTYAYGYQDPSGLFRTVMAYGGAVRIAYMSSPTNFYNGIVTGAAGQDNVRALNANVATVGAFKTTGSSGGSTPPPTPTCTYSVSTTALSFAAGGGSKSVAVTAPTGCSWSTANDAAATWVGLSSAGGSGSGTVTVTAAANTGSARSTTVTIAGKQIAISESASKPPRGKK